MCLCSAVKCVIEKFKSLSPGFQTHSVSFITHSQGWADSFLFLLGQSWDGKRKRKFSLQKNSLQVKTVGAVRAKMLFGIFLCPGVDYGWLSAFLFFSQDLELKFVSADFWVLGGGSRWRNTWVFGESKVQVQVPVCVSDAADLRGDELKVCFLRTSGEIPSAFM